MGLTSDEKRRKQERDEIEHQRKSLALMIKQGQLNNKTQSKHAEQEVYTFSAPSPATK